MASERRPTSAARGYHLLSVREKQRRWQSIHLPPVRCARCLTQCMPDQIAAHLSQRCAGSRELRDAWIAARSQPWFARRSKP